MLGYLSILSAHLWLSLLIVSNIWHVEIMISLVINDVPRCIDNEFEVFVLKSL